MGTVGSMRLLGELLLSQGVITAWQLETALQEQRSTNELLGAILMRKGWITEETLLKTLAQQMEIPYVQFEQEPIDWTVATWFPPALLKEHDCFPMRATEQTVTVAIANTLDMWAISELEKIARSRGRKLQLALAKTQAIHDAVQRSSEEARKSQGL